MITKVLRTVLQAHSDCNCRIVIKKICCKGFPPLTIAFLMEQIEVRTQYYVYSLLQPLIQLVDSVLRLEPATMPEKKTKDG